MSNLDTATKEHWQARNIVLEMLAQRGYETSSVPRNYATFAAQNVAANHGLLNFICTREAPLAVHFTTEDKLSKKALEGLVAEYSAQGVSTVLLVTPHKLNPACKALLKSVQLDFEHFLVEELQFNVTKHCLVPRHRIMAPDEQAAFVKKLGCEKANLPTILTTDPICRFYGARVGDMFEITRSSKTTGVAPYYRIVREFGIKQ